MEKARDPHVNPSQRRRALVFAGPMIITLAAAPRMVGSIRTVDFLLVFAAGAVFGLTLLGFIQALRARCAFSKR